jgi:hypothetical protein
MQEGQAFRRYPWIPPTPCFLSGSGELSTEGPYSYKLGFLLIDGLFTRIA